jgi:hypothetical protein
MPKSTQSKSVSKNVVTEQKFDMFSLYKTVEEYTKQFKTHCLSVIPEELPEDNDIVNKLYETVRDGYVELCRFRELVGTTLHEFSGVMRRVAEHRAKVNTCAEVENEPSSKENVLDEQSDDNPSGENHNVSDDNSDTEQKTAPEPVVEEKPKKKSKKEAKVESEDEAQPEPVVEEKPKKDKKSKKETKVESEDEAQPEPVVEEKSKKDKKSKKH